MGTRVTDEYKEHVIQYQMRALSLADMSGIALTPCCPTQVGARETWPICALEEKEGTPIAGFVIVDESKQQVYCTLIADGIQLEILWKSKILYNVGCLAVCAASSRYHSRLSSHYLRKSDFCRYKTGQAERCGGLAAPHCQVPLHTGADYLADALIWQEHGDEAL